VSWLMAIIGLGFCINLYAKSVDPMVEIATNYGAIRLELYPEKAPQTVRNFLAYVDSGFYDDTIFHRVIDGFMIQGGGFTADMARKETQKPILNEANNGLSNVVGTIAMARTNDPHSATSQFYINVANNTFLNYKSSKNPGYCVFGRVIDGLSVVNAIKQVPVSTWDHYQHVPNEPVVIKRIRRVVPDVVPKADGPQQSPDMPEARPQLD
jgi:peptidyl-prolyl cis-trans isomerase B (cyclophilin B)